MQTNTNSDDFLTVEEAARLARRSHSTIRRWLQPGGLLTRYKSLNRTVVNRSELAELTQPRVAEETAHGAALAVANGGA